MGLILDISDFETGRYTIALDPEQEIGLEEYIDHVEKTYLPKLFGKELYDLFIADWNSPPVGVPTANRFQMVYSALLEQNDCVMVQSIGMNEMLRGMVYYLFLRDYVTFSTTVGLERVVGENVESVSAIQHDITSRWNESIDTFQTIQYYMSSFDAENYPEYKGVKCEFTSIF